MNHRWRYYKTLELFSFLFRWQNKCERMHQWQNPGVESEELPTKAKLTNMKDSLAKLTPRENETREMLEV